MKNETGLEPGSSEIVLAGETGLSTEHVDLTEDFVRAEEDEKHAHAASTRRAYETGWRVFERWCATKNLNPGSTEQGSADPTTIKLFISAMAAGAVAGGNRKGSDAVQPDRPRRPSSIRKVLAAIRYVHEEMGLPSPTSLRMITKHMVAIDNKYAGGHVSKKDPILAKDVVAAVGTIRESPNSEISDRVRLRRAASMARDRTIFLHGFGGAFRRDEMSTLRWSNVKQDAGGVIVHLETSKRDQTGKGRDVRILAGSTPETCPVTALFAMKAANAAAGADVSDDAAVFISLASNSFGAALEGNSFADIVKRVMASMGMDPKRYGAHSLRAGFVTTAKSLHVPDKQIMQKTGHDSVDTLNGYDRTMYDPENDAAKGML